MTMFSSLFRVSLIVSHFGWIAVVLSSSGAYSQSSQVKEPFAESSKTELWVGWVDAPQQQLRTVIRITRDRDNKPIFATIVSPDQSTDELPLVDFEIDPSETWQFKLYNPIDSKLSAK